VSCAYSHSAAIDSDGFLYTWGSATSGKLGVGVVEEQYEQHALLPLPVKLPGKRRIRCVSCGASHTGAVTTAGELFVWGSANGGRLGLGTGVTDMVAVPTLVRELVTKQVRVWQVSCGTAHSACVSEVISEQHGGSKKLLGGQVFICGGPMALGRHIPTWEHVKGLGEVAIRQVSCGTNHTGAVSAYGELYTWGRNRRGCTGHDAKVR
jgi:alpha-tubulin suppressor-like RCC1 family protein